jgi:hypothetical protein
MANAYQISGALKGMSPDSTPASYNYACDECGATFLAMEDLTSHYRQDHPETH